MRVNLFRILLCLLVFSSAISSFAKSVYVIPVDGAIEPALLYVFQRGIDGATKSESDAIILSMNTPGGRLDVTDEIIDLIGSSKIPVYTFVEKNAFSAGAMIALSTKSIYMAPGSAIGDAMPIRIGPTGEISESSDDIQEKMVAATAAMARRAAELGGHNPKLAEAMVRRELGYSIDGKEICPPGQLLTLTNVEAAQLVGNPPAPLLSAGTVSDIDEVLEKIGFGGAEVIELNVTSFEKIARLISSIAPILLMVGLGGVFIEIKSPGFGLPGIIGGLALGLFFFGHHIAGLAGFEDAILFGIGLILIIVEVFVLPGFGIAGIAGIIVLLIAIINAMIFTLPSSPWFPIPTDLDSLLPAFKTLSIALIGTAVIVFCFARFLPKSKIPLILGEVEEFKNSNEDRNALIGRVGFASTNLRPSGVGIFDDDRFDVITSGEFIESQTKIRIVSVSGNRIVVSSI